MAADRIADGLAQRIEIVGFGEDRVTERARHEAAFRRFFDRKDDLAREFTPGGESSFLVPQDSSQRATSS
jgi:hypothetical protein